MPHPFIVAAGVAGGIIAGVKELQSRKAQQEAERAAREPPPFPHEISRDFTNVVRNVRYFDPDVALHMPEVLRMRAVELQPNQLLGINGKVWKIVPAAMGLQTAESVLLDAWREGQTVIGSLSLVLIPNGAPFTSMLIVGGPDLARLASGTGFHWAALQEQKVIVPPAPEPVPATVVASERTRPATVASEDQPAPKNGAVLGSVFEAAKAPTPANGEASKES